MPIDPNKLLQRLQQFNTTGTESTTISDQWIQGRQQQRAEELGNKINKTTGKPNKRSETWLQSQDKSVPGLDTAGESMLQAMDVIYGGMAAKDLAKLIPALKNLGTNKAKQLAETLTLRETSGSGYPMPNPTKLITNRAQTWEDDTIGELMNLGSEKGGRFYNRQKPLSVNEWTQIQKNQRNYLVRSKYERMTKDEWLRKNNAYRS